jgi:D-3-phosphoglycerate dehydrogenase
MKVLVTCPPMLGVMDQLLSTFERQGLTATCPRVTQTLSVPELLKLVPAHDGWIIGDDPATRKVLAAGAAGNLRAAVKWGAGVDNVDFEACKELGIPVTNTPGTFGNEVADLALGYLIALARETFAIDRAVRAGSWPKPRGLSLANKTVAMLGYGEIGRQLLPRLRALQMRVIVFDPNSAAEPSPMVLNSRWPALIEEADFLVIVCALNANTRGLVDARVLRSCKRGLRLINVARGAIVDEAVLAQALHEGLVHSAALDVFETEPLPAGSALRRFESCIFGSHNASNTSEAVMRTSELAIEKLLTLLGENRVR